MSPLSSSIYILSSVFETTDEMYDFCFTRLYSKSSSEQACLFSLKATQDSPMFTFLLNCSELYKGSLALFLNQPCYTPVDQGNYLKSVVRRSITAPNLGLSYQNPLSEVVMSSWDVSCSKQRTSLLYVCSDPFRSQRCMSVLLSSCQKTTLAIHVHYCAFLPQVEVYIRISGANLCVSSSLTNTQ